MYEWPFETLADVPQHMYSAQDGVCIISHVYLDCSTFSRMIIWFIYVK